MGELEGLTVEGEGRVEEGGVPVGEPGPRPVSHLPCPRHPTLVAQVVVVDLEKLFPLG